MATVSHAWQVLLSLPLPARAGIALFAAVVPLGIWSLSKAAAVVLVGAAGVAVSFAHRLAGRFKPRTPELVVTGPIPVRPDEPAWRRDDVIEAWVSAWVNGDASPDRRKDAER
jgi:hypothetical protein